MNRFFVLLEEATLENVQSGEWFYDEVEGLTRDRNCIHRRKCRTIKELLNKVQNPETSVATGDAILTNPDNQIKIKPEGNTAQKEVDNSKAVDIDSLAEEVEKFRNYNYDEFVERVNTLMEDYEGEALSNEIVSQIIEPLKAGTRSYWKAMQSKHEEVIKLSKELAALKEMYLKSAGEDQWINAENPPEESGRYWCYVEEINDLGIGYFQWNCFYDESTKLFYDNLKIMHVTHWMPLPPPPSANNLTT